MRAAHRECLRCPHPGHLRWRHLRPRDKAFVIGVVLAAFVVRPHVDLGRVTFAFDLIEAPQHLVWWLEQALFWAGLVAVLAWVHVHHHRRRSGPDDAPPDPPPGGNELDEPALILGDVLATFAASKPAPDPTRQRTPR